MAGSVEKIYGNALLDTAENEQELLCLKKDAETVLSYIGSDSELSRFLAHPRISQKEKLESLTQIFGGQVSEKMTGLFSVVLEKGRETALAGILYYFTEAAKERLNIGTVLITAPFAVDDEKKRAIEEKLKQTAPYRTLEFRYETDPSLIGGLVIRVGDKVVDSSIRTKLKQLERELYKIQLG